MSNEITEYTSKRKTISEYDILRVAATLLVIIGHSTYCSIVTPYGGCDYTAFTLPGPSVFYRLAGYGVAMIYLFHMPLYMALSGALYRVKKTRGGIALIRTLLRTRQKSCCSHLL